MPKFMIKKISSRGADHPVSGRLGMQMFELLDFGRFEKTAKDGIKRACLTDLQSRLGTCWDICDRIEDQVKQGIESYQPSEEKVVEVPHLEELERDADNFLHEAKNFLRDLVNKVVAAAFPDIEFSDARSLVPRKGAEDSAIVLWAKETFGDEDYFTKMLADDQSWIAELIQKRNAIEHPDGNAGILTIQNFTVTEDGQLIPPVWHRAESTVNPVATDMRAYCENLLGFAEELIILGCVSKNIISEGIVIAKLPDSEIAGPASARFRAFLKKDVTQESNS